MQATVWCAELAGQKLAKWGFLRYEGNQRGAAPLLSGRSKPLATPDACAFEVQDFFGSGARAPASIPTERCERATKRNACSAAAFYGCVGLRDLVDEHGTEVRGVAPVLGAGRVQDLVPEIEIDHERVRQQAGYDIRHRDPTSQPHYFAHPSDRP